MPNKNDDRWPHGDGEMARLVRKHDWAPTPLGPIDTWPMRLRITVDLTLGSPVATVLLWGPTHIQIYNDRWRALMGGKHPAALGQPTHDCFPEIADTMAPLYTRAQSGEAVVLQDMLLPIGRDGMVQEAWWNVHYLPVRDDGGSVLGIFCTVIETTTGVLAERKWAGAVSALREREARFHALVTSGSYAVYRMSPDWRQMYELDGRGFLADTSGPHEGWEDTYILPDDRPMVLAAIEAAVRDKCMFELEHRVRRADRSVGWTLSRAVPMLAPDGEIVEWFGASSDITPRKRAEAVLRDSEERQTFLLKLSDELRPLADPADIQEAATQVLGEHLRANRVIYVQVTDDEYIIERDYVSGVRSMAGRHRISAFGPNKVADYLAGKTRVVRDTKADAHNDAEAVANFAAVDVRAGIGVPLIKKNRLVATLVVHMSERRDWTPEEVTIVEEAAERTWAAVERARAEKALAASEERFRTLAESIEDVFYMTNLEQSALEYLSPAYERIWGRPTAELLGNLSIFPDTLHPDDLSIFEAGKTAQVLGEPVAVEYRIVRPDGEVRWIYDRSFPVGDGVGRRSAGIASDVTARRQADAAARETEERLRQFGEASQDILWIRDAETLQWTYLTPAFETIYGLSREEALSGDNYRGWQELIVPDDLPHAVSSIDRVRAGKHVTFEYRIRRPIDGRVRWLRNTDFPMRDAHGRVVQIGGVGHDVTEMKAIEAALTHSEQRLRTLVDGVPQLVWRAIDGGDWTWASPQWAAYTGQSEPGSHHHGWLEPLHPDDRDRAMTAWDHALETGGFEVEYRIRRAADGAYCWFQTRATPLRDEVGDIKEWLGTSTDIDDLRHLQQSQAVMVTELQHRTRNLIAVVQAIAEDTMEHTGPTDAFRDAFADRLSALSRVQSLLSRSEAKPITIDALVRLELDALGASTSNGRVTATGPEVYRTRPTKTALRGDGFAADLTGLRLA